MADFPQGRLPVRLRLAFGADPAGDPSAWTWTDVSGAIDQQTISIQRGRANEASQTAPTSSGVELNNPDGDYTPDHPAGTHYPHVVQGVPAQFWLQAGGPHLLIPNEFGARARVASSSDLDVAEDLDVRVELALDTLPSQQPPGFSDPGAQISTEVIARYNATGSPGNRMWRLLLTSWGRPSLGWSTNGDDLLFLNADDVVPYGSGQTFALRVTLDTDNGNGGHTARFYTAPTIDGPWAPLGAEVTGTGTTSINQTGDASLEIGDINTIGFARGAGRYYAAQLRDGIDGTLLADPDFTAQETGTTSFTDDAGNLWELQQGCEITDWVRRAVGNVDEWLPEWPYGDLSDEDSGYMGEARTSITISGILRRLGIGEDQLQSAVRREFTNPSRQNIIAYWTAEDDQDATQLASAVAGVPALAISGTIDLASYTDWVASAALPVLRDGRLTGSVPDYDASAGELSARFFLRADPQGVDAETDLVSIFTDGSVTEWRIRLRPDGSMRLRMYDSDNSELDSHIIAFDDVNGTQLHVGLELVQNGSDIDWTLRILYIDQGTLTSLPGQSFSETLASHSFDRATSVRVGAQGRLGDTAFGHLALANAIAAYNQTGPALNAWRFERALDRLRRLAHEEQLPLSVLGVPAHSQQMGAQSIATLMELIQECAAADGGILSELREVAGLQYRAQYLLHNQPVALTLDAAANEFANPFAPVLNDQRLRNIIEVQRRDGSSARAVDTDSIARSGRYKEGQITLNVATDEQLPGIAAWRLHLGTWPGMRYPAVSADLAVAPQLIDDWLSVDSGSRLQVTGLPPQHPSGTVNLLVEGTVETITPTKWTVQANCSPAGPWTVASVAADDPADDGAAVRVDLDSTLADGVDATATEWTVHTADGDWVTSGGLNPTSDGQDLPFQIRCGGETVEVTQSQDLAWDGFDRTEAYGPALNANTDFEDNLDDWTPFGATLDRVPTPPGAPFPGQWSMRVTPDGVEQFPNAGSELIPVTAGEDYNLSGWLRCTTSRNVALNINWFDAAFTYLSTSANDQAVTADTWQLFSLTATAPATAAFANASPTVPDFPPATDVLTADEIRFSAVVADTWGRADSGHTWTEVGGAPSDRSLDGTAGVITLAADSTVIRFQQITEDIGDTEVLVRMAAQQISTGGSMIPGVLLRADGADYYRARLHFGTGGDMFTSIASGTDSIGTAPLLPYTYTAGEWFWLRARVDGHRVRVRAWPVDRFEPQEWYSDEVVDTGTSDSGAVGVTCSTFASNNNPGPAVAYDGFQVITPQRFTVTRSVKVIKPHAAGEGIRLAVTPVVALQ